MKSDLKADRTRMGELEDQIKELKTLQSKIIDEGKSFLVVTSQL